MAAAPAWFARHRLALGTGVVAVVVAVLAWRWLADGSGETTYETVAVSRGAVRLSVSSSGTVSPINTVTVGSQVSGLITQVLVDFNSPVKQGQLVAVIDPATLQSKLRSAEADLQVQQANIGSNEVLVSNAQVTLDQAQRDFDRTKVLADQGLLSTSDLEKASNALDQARNQLKIANATLNNSRAQLVRVQATADQARIDLSRSEIRSPVDGVVIERDVDVGQTVAAAMTAPVLFKIARDLSRIQIETKVDEADIGTVRQASRATFTVDAYPDRSFEGRIVQVRINGQPVANVVTYSVMVQAENPGQQLLPGMTANVRLVTDERADVLRLPNLALRFRPEGAGAGGAGDAGGATRGEPRGQDAAARGAGGAPAGGAAPGGTGNASGLLPGMPGSGIGPRPLPALTAEVMQKLGLTERQQAQVPGALEAANARIRADMQRNAGGGNPLGNNAPNFRRLFGKPEDDAPLNRQRVLNSLSVVMDEAQLQQYQALAVTQLERDGTVWVPDASGKPAARAVRVGLADDNYTELLAGLAEGDKVIVRARTAGKGRP
jgi:HlyD family secretion protein